MIRHILLTFLFCFSSNLTAGDKGPPIKGDWNLSLIAEDVYVIHGPIGVPSPDNQGFMNNPGFVVTSSGIVVIDPGGSVQTGELLLAKIAETSSLPVVAVFDTHIHGDHWLGNQAIKAKYPEAEIYAHPEMIEQVKKGAGEDWIVMAMRMTEGAVKGTKTESPTSSVNNGQIIQIGDTEFHIYNNIKAHTDTDIMIRVPGKNVMFLGDNASVNRIIRHEHGSVKGNIEALKIALQTNTEIFIPGHGPSGKDAAKLYYDYLSTVYTGVKEGYEQGLSDFEIKPLLENKLNKWSNWDDFDRILGKHINASYLEIEAADFN